MWIKCCVWLGLDSCMPCTSNHVFIAWAEMSHPQLRQRWTHLCVRPCNKSRLWKTSCWKPPVSKSHPLERVWSLLLTQTHENFQNCTSASFFLNIVTKYGSSNTGWKEKALQWQKGDDQDVLLLKSMVNASSWFRWKHYWRQACLGSWRYLIKCPK